MVYKVKKILFYNFEKASNIFTCQADPLKKERVEDAVTSFSWKVIKKELA
jgi:hypothetical protein